MTAKLMPEEPSEEMIDAGYNARVEVGRLTTAMRRVLEHLRDAEDREDFDEADLLCCGLVCFAGSLRTSVQVVRALNRIVAIRDESAGMKEQHYRINESGRNYLNDESQILVVLRYLYSSIPMTWRDGKAVPLL